MVNVIDFPTYVAICEVGPRDGLQNEAVRVSTEEKVKLIELVSEAGVPEIEVTAFVHPGLVPQMADASDVLTAARLRVDSHLRVLVPNVKGAQRALASAEGAPPELLQVIGASETFNKRNVRQTVQESEAALEEVARLAHASGTSVMLSIACAFGCPFEGEVSQSRIMRLVRTGADLGISRVELCDTIGVANPKQVYRVSSEVQSAFPAMRLGLHLHDTRGLGLANVLAGLEAGIEEFDASLGGLGGCPFAPGATGNICTIDLVNLLDSLGVDTGMSLPALLEGGEWLQERLGRRLPGHVLQAGLRA